MNNVIKDVIEEILTSLSKLLESIIEIIERIFGILERIRLELESIIFTSTRNINKNIKRNPHLSVYRAQRDSLLSIFHRFSMMSVYVAILFCNFWLIFPNGFNLVFCIIPGLCEWIYDLIKIMVFIFGVFYLCMWNTEQQGQAVRLSFQKQEQERFYAVNWMSWVLISSLFVVLISQIYLI